MIRGMGPATSMDLGEYELLDAGDARRLERLGSLVVDRPAPTAMYWPRDPAAWSAADLRFDRGTGWTIGAPESLEVRFAGLLLDARPTTSGGLGLYPEHAANLAWLEDQIEKRSTTGGAPTQVLNLFAHTGLVTLAAARAGAAVAHVDSARTVVAWARRNASLSNLDDRPIRWLVDDAAAFVAREARRERRYDGLVLDPPSFGHAGRRRWRLEDELPGLLRACASILAEDGFVLLTSHTTGLHGEALEAAVRDAIAPRAARLATEPLVLHAASGVRLELGWSVRVAG